MPSLETRHQRSPGPVSALACPELPASACGSLQRPATCACPHPRSPCASDPGGCRSDDEFRAKKLGAPKSLLETVPGIVRDTVNIPWSILSDLVR